MEPTLVTPVVLKINEWTVNFSEIYKSITRPVLFNRSREENKQIKNYFGRSFYKGLFMWKTSQEGRIVVRLGKVDEMATVRINSINCGTVWTAPYEVDITDALRYVSGTPAGIAQLVEQLICNQQVGGSSPSTGSTQKAK